MEEVTTGQLKRVIEIQHGAKSTFVKTVKVHHSGAIGNRMDTARQKRMWS